MPFTGFSESFLKSLIAESLQTAMPGQWNITRHYMYSRLMRCLADHDAPHRKCLAISHSTFFAQLLGLTESTITESNYPECDMLALAHPEASYDFCVSDQVLEHIAGSPLDAFAETVRVTRPKGFVAHTTCFMNQIHETPKDFWRFTPDALRFMAEKCGVRVLECGGWGNKDVWSFMELGFRTVRMPSDPSHPICRMAMTNDGTIPIVTWVIAQKP